MHDSFNKREAEKNWGPLPYDLGAGVAKFRGRAAKAGSVMALAKAERHAYADAIEKAIRAKHRALHMRPTPATTVPKIQLTPIARLFHYEKPIPMAGDPPWRRDGSWAEREKVLYAHAMARK